MLSSQKVFFVSIIGILVMASACTSLRANIFLIKTTTPQEKAAMLFDEGLTRYKTDLLKSNDLKKIPEIRRYFSDALALDPEHPQAQKYISELDSYKQKVYTSSLDKAKKLAVVEKRSETQDYELVYAVKQASDLQSGDAELGKLKKTTKDLEPTVIQARLDKIALLEPKIIAESDAKTLAKLMADANRALTEIQNIDPGNKTAAQSRANINAHVASLAKNDIDLAQEKLTAKKYADAETAILRAEKNQAAIMSEKNPQIQTIKYQTYYAWGSALLSSKKYQLANEKATKALSVNRTSEALALKTKINNSASVRDYDSEIDDILNSVNELLAQEDPVGAQNAIQENIPKLKNQENKNKLSAKTTDVNAQIKQLYQDGIALYNEEDYESAIQKFRVVVKVNPDYEQAQAYLDRSNTKIRALAGKD